MKFVTIFFDLERWWIARHARQIYLEKIVRKISKVLDKNKVKAVYNTCGIVVENFPDLVKELHDKGHEIASHGYAHENFIQLEQLGQLNNVLGRTEKLIKNTTGERPIGIRSPWLFSDRMVYSTIEKRGYRWISNYNVFRTEILNNPLINTNFKIMKYAFFSLLWKFSKKEPFKVNNLLEIPLLSSDDGGVLGLIDPAQKSPKRWLDFAYQTLKTQFDKSGKIFNLNFHPWLIGSSNRITLLSRILDYINQKNPKFVLARDLLEYYS